MGIFSRTPPSPPEVKEHVLDRIGVDSVSSVGGNVTIWMIRLVDQSGRYRVWTEMAPDGHLQLAKPGDRLTITWHGDRVSKLHNNSL
jgi:hypothetical protein